MFLHRINDSTNCRPKYNSYFKIALSKVLKNHFLRPSALDWCTALADFLNLPFKGIPDYNFPLKELLKVDFQASNLYFTPSLSDLDAIDLEPIPNYSPYSIKFN